ncbi:MAG: hypothetical protein K2X08_08160 [Chlamydiales bacterium]|nr:hypothetical protein [Chlamydiales bacterium]
MSIDALSSGMDFGFDSFSSKSPALNSLKSRNEILLKQKEALIQRINVLREEIITLNSNQEDKKTLLEKEKNRLDNAILTQQENNVSLKIMNSELGEKVLSYQRELSIHHCPGPYNTIYLMLRYVYNSQRARYRQQGAPIETFIQLLKGPIAPILPL